MNASGSKPDVIWSPPIDIPITATSATKTITNSPPSDGDSEGIFKPTFPFPPSADLFSTSASMILPNFTRSAFSNRFMTELYSLSINPMVRLLLAQAGATALSSLSQNSQIPLPSGGPEHESPKNLFTIADYIGEDVKDDENQECREEEPEATEVERSRNKNGALCCPICHEELNSKDLPVHISLELQSLEEETQRLQNCCYDRNLYARCMNFNTSTLFDHISSSQRYCKFQLVKERRLARKRNFPYNKVHDDYDRGGQQTMKPASTLEIGFPLFCPQISPNIPNKIRRIEK